MKAKSKSRQDRKADLLTTFLRLITGAFPNDKLAPGVVSSFLPASQRRHPAAGIPYGKDCFYASVIRYPLAGNKEVVITAYGDSIQDAHAKLAKTFMGNVQLVRELERLIRRG